MKQSAKKTQTGSRDRCCSVSAVVAVDERGQIVLPKELRDRIGLKTGDKLAVIAMGDPDKSCCLMLMKARDLNGMVKIKIDALMGKQKMAV